MRIPKPEWLAALRDLCGDQVRLSWNETVGRWQFDVMCVDGRYQPQFFCQTKDPITGKLLEVQGLEMLPFRELDDESFREVLRNLEKSYLGNPHDGQVLPGRHVRKIARENSALGQRQRQDRINSTEGWLSHHWNRLHGNVSVAVAKKIN